MRPEQQILMCPPEKASSVCISMRQPSLLRNTKKLSSRSPRQRKGAQRSQIPTLSEGTCCLRRHRGVLRHRRGLPTNLHLPHENACRSVTKYFSATPKTNPGCVNHCSYVLRSYSIIVASASIFPETFRASEFSQTACTTRKNGVNHGSTKITRPSAFNTRRISLKVRCKSPGNSGK